MIGAFTCHYCSCAIGPNKVATYTGMDGSVHVFRLHPGFNCPNCGKRLDYVNIVCNSGYEVTNEFKVLKESHST